MATAVRTDAPSLVSSHDPVRWPWAQWLLFVGGLTLLSLLTMLHLIVVYTLREKGISLREAFFSGLATWYPWLLLAPFIFALTRRFPFEPGVWRRSMLVHVPFGVACSAIHSTLRAGLSYFPWVDAHPLPLVPLILSQFYLTFLAYWILVAVHEAWHNYRRFRDRELRASQLQAKLAQAQLEVLKMQLHPHFLFNTLHAISTLVHKDPDAADEMIAQLSDLLRMTLDTIGIQEVSLQQELDFLQRYLDIQQMRFHDRLRVRIDVPSETLDARVPNQILQPIVENAIRHGLDKQVGSGLIEIRARGTSAMLQLTVRDNGPGLKVNGTALPQEGIGLANTRARLKELYGPLASLDLANHETGGLMVTLLIPQSSGTGAPRPEVVSA